MEPLQCVCKEEIWGKRMSYISKLTILLSILITSFSLPVSANVTCKEPAGRFASIEGSVQFLPNETDRWKTANNGKPLCNGDTIRVEELSRAAVILTNDAIMRLDQNTTMRLLNISNKKEEKSFVELVKGAIKSFIRKPRLLSVNTPYLNGSIEGTEFQVTSNKDKSSILVLEGRIIASNKHGNVSISPGEIAESTKGAAPTSRIVINPRNAVQWSLYYPSISSRIQSISELNKTHSKDRNGDFYIKRASSLLSLGRHNEAQSDINVALKRDQNLGMAHALQSIIYIVKNDYKSAKQSAEKAVNLDDNSSTRIALSYVQQANFEIDSAKNSLLVAVDKQPNKALAWARLSELWLMLGEKEKSVQAADKATKLDPNQSRTHLVKGFAALADFDSGNAQSSFEKSIQLNSSDPMAHLGIGLAKISQGQLSEGRSEIEIAVALDSSNALLRSYLGKAYYEETRSPLDAQQFEIAKQLDPLDPTAFLYDGIRKQTENDPIEALQDIEKSIALNDNRAVYRSRLLLDSDNASRNTNLAQAYNDIGFEKLALIEGTKSVNTDPSNSSAHRFLSDSYAAIPRHEIARVSELLQAQLLNPLNTAPIQASLAESNQFLMSGGGPTNGGFNEFNSLFNLDGTRFYIAGMGGSHNTTGAEVVASQVSGNTVLSAGISNYTAGDSWRENTDQKDDIANLFWQTQFTSNTSIQAEYRNRKSETGDLTMRFFENEYAPGQRNEFDQQSLRLGMRNSLSPNSIILTSMIYQEKDNKGYDNQFAIFSGGAVNDIDISIPEKSSSAEIQHLYQSSETKGFKLTSGIGYFDVESDINVSYTVLPPFAPNVLIIEQTPASVQHSNVYSYGNIFPTNDLMLTIGASIDSITGNITGGDKEQVNPKFGIIWEASKGTTIRAASFKTYKRSLVTNQTLEPTQIAGFNQFFDDFNFTSATNTAFGIDQKFSNNLTGGLEYTSRDLIVPYIQAAPLPPLAATSNRNETITRAYLYWTPLNKLAVKLEYSIEDTKHDPDLPDGVLDLKTDRLVLGANYFFTKSMSFSTNLIQVTQKGNFAGLLTGGAGSEDFTLVNIAANYKLSSRQGVISVGINNLLDEKFKYYDLDDNNSSIHPDRMVFARVTYSF